MKMRTIFARGLLALAGLASALTPAEWRPQSIYQVITDRFARTDGSTTSCSDWGVFCGGTYQGIINKLDYIQDMGFTAIWISPVVKNLEGNTRWGAAYHGYWQTDIYSVETNFGSAADLVALSNELHSRNMYLMVDVVTNHMAQRNARNTIEYDQFNPFDNQSYFHTPGSNCDFSNGDAYNLTHCWQGDDNVALADLRTEDTNVQSMLNTWIAQLVQNFTIDGLRIDSARHVGPASLQSLQAAAGGIHVLGEIYNGDPTYVGPFQNWYSGFVNFPQMYRITEAFESTEGSMTGLVDGVNNMQLACSDTTVLGSFIENHDIPRFPNITQDNSLISNAIAFNMLQDGIPIIYQGQEQKFSGRDSPYNREPLWMSEYSQNSNLYLLIQKLNNLRSWAIQYNIDYITKLAIPISLDSRTTVLRKGNPSAQVVSIFNNRGENGGNFTFTLVQNHSEFVPLEVIMDIIACEMYTTDSRGNLGLTITNGEPIVLYPAEALRGSDICVFEKRR